MIDRKHDAELSRFEPADYLTTEEAIQEYVAAAIEDGDPAGIARARNDATRARTRIAPHVTSVPDTTNGS